MEKSQYNLDKKSLCHFVSDVNDCMPNPCENGGSCTDGFNEYNCSCVAGYTGTDCETGKLLQLYCKMNIIPNVHITIFQYINSL